MLERTVSVRQARAPRPAAVSSRAKGTTALLSHLARRPHTNAAPAAQAAPADQGLGRIFFFALGVVLLVLAGVVWGVAAIFGIGFWKALGFVGLGLLALLAIKGIIELLSPS